jgi:hypothetical protein
MVEAYRKRFKALAPFTEDALFTLARMSREIFRRFLRYITLALQLQEVDTINTAKLRKFVDQSKGNTSPFRAAGKESTAVQ